MYRRLRRLLENCLGNRIIESQEDMDRTLLEAMRPDCEEFFDLALQVEERRRGILQSSRPSTPTRFSANHGWKEEVRYAVL